MKAYTATFEMNNGYTCTCCRETWTVERDAEFEDGTPYDEVREYFEKMEHDDCALLHIQRTDVSPSDIDELQNEVSRLKKELEGAKCEIDELKTRLAESEAQRKLLTNLVDAAVLAIGEHNAPSDCYTPTPPTGNAVVCPACEFISMLETLSKLEEK